MSETIQEPFFNERVVLEAQLPNQIVDFILQQGDIMSEAERRMKLAVDVLDGYGTSVEEILKEREKQNGTT